MCKEITYLKHDWEVNYAVLRMKDPISKLWIRRPYLMLLG